MKDFGGFFGCSLEKKKAPLQTMYNPRLFKTNPLEKEHQKWIPMDHIICIVKQWRVGFSSSSEVILSLFLRLSYK